MATSSKTDLFVFGAHGHKPLHEHVTPHKVALLALIYEYCELKKRNMPMSVIEMGCESPGYQKFTETEKRDFMTTILKLLQVNVFCITNDIVRYVRLFIGLKKEANISNNAGFSDCLASDYQGSILQCCFLQSPDLSLKELLEQVQTILKPTLMDNFTDRSV